VLTNSRQVLECLNSREPVLCETNTRLLALLSRLGGHGDHEPERYPLGVSREIVGQKFVTAVGRISGYPEAMNPQQPQPKIHLTTTSDYREHYANSVQVRVSLWDFFLLFGTMNQSAPDAVSIQNFEGIYLSPQQAKALANVLNQNVSQYESTFGEIKLEAKAAGSIQ
jgi:hypothetical protein